MTLWEGDIGSVTIDQCYQFDNLIVRSYQGAKYLSKSKDATFSSISDIGDVAEHDVPEPDVLTGVQVIGVKKLESYSACIACKSKVEPTSLHDNPKN